MPVAMQCSPTHGSIIYLVFSELTPDQRPLVMPQTPCTSMRSAHDAQM